MARTVITSRKQTMKNSKPPTMYRQGDVLITLVDEIPTAVTEVKRDKRGVILAEGEVTGHAHRIPSRHAKLYRTELDARYLRVTAGGTRGDAGAQLEHEEHSTVAIPPGDYQITIHSEYVPGELPRQVAD